MKKLDFTNPKLKAKVTRFSKYEKEDLVTKLITLQEDLRHLEEKLASNNKISTSNDCLINNLKKTIDNNKNIICTLNKKIQNYIKKITEKDNIIKGNAKVNNLMKKIILALLIAIVILLIILTTL